MVPDTCGIDINLLRIIADMNGVLLIGLNSEKTSNIELYKGKQISLLIACLYHMSALMNPNIRCVLSESTL